MENKKIGAYTVVRLLGSGGMGQVYEAVHDQIKRRAAIKILHKRYTNNRQIAQRFINEARAVNIVQHPSLVNIYEFGTAADGSAYIVMEYLDGDTLRQRLEKSGGRLAPDVAARLTRQIASGLSAAHQKGIIHRDLKPVNIMIVPDPEAAGGERAKVLDFGLAKVVLPESESEASGLTHTGTILGTPAYMAPEQCRSARAVDDKSDVYALGVILYEMLSSDIPFDAETDAELLSMHMYKDPPPLREKAPNVHTQLAALVHRMLAKQQADRPSAADVAAELARIPAVHSQNEDAPTQLLPKAARQLANNQETLIDSRRGAAADKKAAAEVSRPPSRAGIIVFGLILVLLAAVGGGALGWLRGRQQGGAQQGNPAGPGPGQPPALPSVRWVLTSVPAGAEVVGGDNQVLGRTPLVLENRHGAGEASLIVRFPGYAESRLSLSMEHDEQRHVELAPLAGGSAPAPAPAVAPSPTPAPAPTPGVATDGGAAAGSEPVPAPEPAPAPAAAQP